MAQNKKKNLNYSQISVFAEINAFFLIYEEINKNMKNHLNLLICQWQIKEIFSYNLTVFQV